MQLVAAVARHSPGQIAPALDHVVPSILKAIQKDDEELREGSLQALEALVLRCSSEVTPYQQAIIQAGVQFIKYDPVSVLDNLLAKRCSDRLDRITRRMMKMRRWLMLMTRMKTKTI